MRLRERVAVTMAGILADAQALVREVEGDDSLTEGDRAAVMLALSRIAAQADLVLGLLGEDGQVH
jgi:hypothetical protein